MMTQRSAITLGLSIALLAGARFNTPAFAQTARPVAGASSTAPMLAPGEIRLTYLGNAGWELTDGRTVVLVDPFLTQFARWTPTGPAREIAPGDLYRPDTALIFKHVKRADFILITHGHSDHALDAGVISRHTGATILGHETAANLARAYDVPDSNIITVVGGEDYAFGDISIRVVPNIHSALDQKHYFNNGRGIAGKAPSGLRAPLRRQDYQEGGNLAYIVRMAGHEILLMGSMNYLEREMEGLRPDIALIGANSQRLEIYEYTARLMRALGNPPIVIPSHADSYGNPKPTAAVMADRKLFAQEVFTASPATRVIEPTWFEPMVFPARSTRASAVSERQVINPPGISPLVPAYSVAIRDGDMVFVSGMTGIKPGTQDIIDGGVGAQTRQTMENIKTSLLAGGATMADVAECTVFLKDMADYAAMNAVYVEFFRVNPPARATLAVSSLPRPAALVEIKCSARVRSGSSSLVPPNPAASREFTKVMLLESESVTSAGVSVGDVDGDGSPDIVLAKGRHWPHNNMVFRNDGRGQFTGMPLADAPDRTYTAALADLDGDGDLDLAVSNDRPDRKLVYFNDGRGNFRVASTFGEPDWSTRYVTVAEVNGDALPDLLVANRSSNPTNPKPSFVCLNDGHGAFPRCSALATQSATIIVAADLDGDGRIDLFVPHRDGGQSLVFWNDGSGTFAAPPTPVGPVKSNVRAATVADMDGNGTLDLVIGDQMAGLFIQLNRGGRLFGDRLPVAGSEGSPFSVGVADLNKDGLPDIVVGNDESPGAIFFNQGGGSRLLFTHASWNDGKGAVYGFKIADLDGDGWPDIVAARSEAPNGVWFNVPVARGAP